MESPTMSAVSNSNNNNDGIQQTPQASSSRIVATTNGASPPPPKTKKVSSGPPDMTMNGNEPPPKKRSTPGGPSSTTSGNTPAAAVTTSGNAAAARPRHRPHTKACDTSYVPRSTGLSGGSPADNDAAYCTEVARRSVARAALHLGLETMEGEALDALGSVLLEYMATVGTTISSNVEASGRSSAHANAYDALNAVEVCTAPAATQLGSSALVLPTTTDTVSSPDSCRGKGNQNRSIEAAQGRGWEGLASFLFGPDWFTILLEGEAGDGSKDSHSGKLEMDAKTLILNNGKANTATAAPKKAPGGKKLLPKRQNSADATMPSTPKSGKGKQLINMKGNEKSVSFSLLDCKPSNSGGDDPAVTGGGDVSSKNAGSGGRWHAPYLNTVPPFPMVANSENVANPHRLPGGAKISLSLHDLATEMEACRDQPMLPCSGKRPRKGSARDQDQKAARAAQIARQKEDLADRAMSSALRIPDNVYLTRDRIWGSIQDPESAPPNDEKKSATTISGGANEKSPADSKKCAVGGGSKASKVKIDPETKPLPPSPATNADAMEPHGTCTLPLLDRRPSYVPNFLPPFPSDLSSDAARRDRLSMSVAALVASDAALSRTHHREKRKPFAVGATGEESSKRAAVSSLEDRDSLRRSVIGLGKSAGSSYWGSGWIDDDVNGTDDGAKTPKPNNFSTVGFVAETVVAPSTAKKSDTNEVSHVAPLGRASGSRLAKILEGSMNVS